MSILQKDKGPRYMGAARPLASAVAAIACALSSAARADPCNAIPERGPLPPAFSQGRTVTGPVVYVGDGDSLCVATRSKSLVEQGPGATWVEIRLADFYAPELHERGGEAAKTMLRRIAGGQVISCRIDHRSYDRAVARCLTSAGASIGDLMRQAGVEEAGRNFSAR